MQIVVIAHNIRSTYNVGSILRTCDGFGAKGLYCTGYTPYPLVPGDTRLPHERNKITAHIHKTALGAERNVQVDVRDNPLTAINELRNKGYQIVALEQTPNAIPLPSFHAAANKVALLLGEEVHGTPPELLAACDAIVEIPMHGKKESFNVSVATGIALYGLCS